MCVLCAVVCILRVYIVYYLYATRPERFEFFVLFGGGVLAEVDFWCFLCYNRNKFHCVKDAVNCFRLGFFRLALTSILFVLGTVYRQSSTILATTHLLA